MTNHSSVIHEYYARECNNPVHLTVDTSLQGGRMGLKAYVCINLGVPGGKSGNMFTPINTEVTYYEPEVSFTINKLRNSSKIILNFNGFVRLLFIIRLLVCSYVKRQLLIVRMCHRCLI